MKTPPLIILAATLCASALAQGTVNFINIVGSLNAPDFRYDGTKISGAGFTAELLAGTSPTSLAIVAQTGFLTGAAAGYFNGGTVTLANIAPGATGFFQVRIFDTSKGSFILAQAAGVYDTWGMSPIFQAVTGGAGIPPSTPAPLTGLTSITLFGVPEPSAIALAGLGVVLAVASRSKR